MDCSAVSELSGNLSRAELDALDALPCHKDFNRNAYALGTTTFDGKMFIVAARDISPGEEIYYDYTKAYWARYFKE